MIGAIIDSTEIRRCLCGCGEQIIWKKKYKYIGWAKYIQNHGKPAWNKGLTKDTHPSLKILAEKIRNVPVTEETRRIISIAQKKRFQKYPTYNKGLTKENCESLRKVSESKKGKPTWIKGKTKFNSSGVAKISDWMKRNRLGEKNSGWLGGKSKEKYAKDYTEKLKKFIRGRDNFTCQVCASPQTTRLQSIHHIDYNKLNTSVDNLITLCMYCHCETNYTREKWTYYFKKIIKLKMEKLA